MWYHAAALISDMPDVARCGASIVRLAVRLVFFGHLAVTAIPNGWQQGCDVPRK